jgi:hypothetical protein
MNKIDRDNNNSKDIQQDLMDIYKFLSDNNYQKNIKLILKGTDEVKDIFKINKQKHKFIESYENDENYNDIIDFAHKLEDQLRNNFNNSEIIYEYLMDIKEILKSIEHIDNSNKYVKLFLTEIINNKNLQRPLNLFNDCLAGYMDHYTIYRMLRKFDNLEQKNIIFYGGAFHSNNIYKILKNTEYFDVLIKRKTNDYDLHDCQILK